MLKSMTINILTKNAGKLMAARLIFKRYGIEVNQIDKDYPEIQADNSLEIAKFTSLQAAKDLNLAVVREDHSLFINALGIPGPYTSYIEKQLPAKKLLEIMQDQPDRNGYFEVATVYAEPDGFTKEYILKAPIIFAEEERVEIWGKNYEAIAKWLINNKK